MEGSAATPKVTTDKKPPYLPLGLAIVVGLILTTVFGYLLGSNKGDLVNTISNSPFSLVNTECNDLHIDDDGYPLSGWENKAYTDTSTAYLVETNALEGVLCKHQVYTAAENNFISNVHFHQFENSMSFIETNERVSEFIVIDVFSGELVSKISIDPALDYETAYGFQYGESGNYIGGITLINPIIETEETPLVTIARTDGIFFNVSRSELSITQGFEDILVRNGQIEIYQALENSSEALNTLKVAEFSTDNLF